MDSDYASAVQGASLILGSYKPKKPDTVSEGSTDDTTGKSDEPDDRIRLAALLEAGILYSRARTHGFVQDEPGRKGTESVTPSTIATNKWTAPRVSYERLSENIGAVDGSIPSVVDAFLAEDAAWLSRLMVRKVQKLPEDADGDPVMYWNSFGERVYLESSPTQTGQSTGVSAEEGDTPLEANLASKENTQSSLFEVTASLASENTSSLLGLPQDQGLEIEKQLGELTMEDQNATDLLQGDIDRKGEVEAEPDRTPILDNMDKSRQDNDDDDQHTSGEDFQHSTTERGIIVISYGTTEDVIKLEELAEFFWNDGPSTSCEICDGGFLDGKGPAIRTMSMAPCQAMFSGLNGLPGLTGLPEIAVRIHNRHLCCIEKTGISIIPISHVWHEGVARANIEQKMNDDAISDIFFQPLYILKLATFRFIEILGHVEIWHDYFSIPQFRRNIQQKLLLVLPYIYRVAPWCLVHLEDVSSTTIRDMFPSLGDDTVASHLHRVSCIMGFSAAKWFRRMWVNLEFISSQRACVLTSDGCILYWHGHELTRDSLSLFLDQAMMEKREIDVQLGMQLSPSQYRQYKAMTPTSAPTLSARSRQIPGQEITYGEAVEAMSRLDCREYRDRFIALVGMLSLGSDLNNTTIQIPDDPVQACLLIARRCLQRGDHTPLILTPCGNEKEVDGARWLVGHENMSEKMCFFGRRISPPSNPSILIGTQVKFEMQHVGEITKTTWVDFNRGVELENFDAVAEMIVDTMGANVPAFIDAILRIYCVPFYMIDPEIPNTYAEYESIDAQLVDDFVKILEQYRKHIELKEKDLRLFTCSYMVKRLRLTRPYRSNLPSARGPFTRLMYAGSFSAADFYLDTIAVVRCPGCLRSFVFRIFVYVDELSKAQLYRIQGLGYEGSSTNGVGLVISEGKIVGKMVYGTPACECEVLQMVEIE